MVYKFQLQRLHAVLFSLALPRLDLSQHLKYRFVLLFLCGSPVLDYFYNVLQASVNHLLYIMS